MKRTYRLAAAFAAALILTSCSGKTSVGVIGGADGPTEIVVTGADKEDAAAEHIDMFMLAGSLYYDTGERTGAPDGGTAARLEKECGAFEAPKSDGEANFFYNGDIRLFDDGTAYATDRRFQRLDPESAPKYKYCYTLSGVMPNASAGTVFLVLADDVDVTFDDAVYKLVGSDLRKMKDAYVFPISSF